MKRKLLQPVLICKRVWLHYGYVCYIFMIIMSTQLYSQADTLRFIKGADVSFIPQIEDYGGVYKVNNIPHDPLKIFKDHASITSA